MTRSQFTHSFRSRNPQASTGDTRRAWATYKAQQEAHTPPKAGSGGIFEGQDWGDQLLADIQVKKAWENYRRAKEEAQLEALIKEEEAMKALLIQKEVETLACKLASWAKNSSRFEEKDTIQIRKVYYRRDEVARRLS